jgi:hypothetical protein
MRNRTKSRAAEHFNAVMSEVLETAWGGAQPTSARKVGHVQIMRQDPFHVCSPRLICIEDDGDVRTGAGLLCFDDETKGVGWGRDPIRLVIQIGETGTGAPLAAAAMERSEVLRISTELLSWLDIVAGAGGFDQELLSSQVDAVLAQATALKRTFATRLKQPA